MSLKVLSLFLAFCVFCFVIDLIRREKLTFKYGFAWLIFSSLICLLSVFDSVLYKLADYCGFVLMSNFIFFTLFCVFILLSLILTIFLCQQNFRNDCMAQKIALLETEIEVLKKKKIK